MSTTETCRPLRADAERNRTRILASARELFAERGPDVSLDDVAAHAGVGVGTVYRRFANREELMQGVALAHLDEVRVRVEQAIDNPDPWRGLVDAMTFMCESIADDRGLGVVMMRVEDSSIESAKRAMLTPVHTLFTRVQSSGLLREDAAETDFFAFLCMVSAVADVTRDAAAGTWRRYLTLLLDSMRADGAQTALTVPALTFEQIEQSKRSKCADH